MDKLTLESKLEKWLSLPNGAEGKIVTEMKAYFKKSKKTFAVVGLSGGVDSALTCYLAAKALGPLNVYAYHLPYVQKPADEKDSQQLAKMLKVNFQKIDIRRIVDTYHETLKPRTRIIAGNLRVRTRMLILYSFANQFDGLVLGTGNRTELSLGYFTKYGDGGCDLLPIGNLYKTQVWEMARRSGLPKHIVEKVPTAGMWDNQTDEAEIGVRYSEIDKILSSHLDLKISWQDLLKLFDKNKVARIKELTEQSEHKRKMPPIL